MKETETCRLPASTLAALLHDGSLRAEAVIDAVLARCEALQPAFNAFALIDADGARQAARAADAARTRGDTLAPLLGVPFSVKDLVHTKALETAFGSHLMAGRTPDGLPTGIQAVAPRHGEQCLVDLAAALEQIQSRPMVPIVKSDCAP